MNGQTDSEISYSIRLWDTLITDAKVCQCGWPTNVTLVDRLRWTNSNEKGVFSPVVRENWKATDYGSYCGVWIINGLTHMEDLISWKGTPSQVLCA